MANTYNIAVLFKLLDKFSGPSKKLAKNVSNLQNKFQKLGQKLTTFGKNLTKYVTLPIVGLGAYAVRNAMKIEKWGIAFETLLGSVAKSEKIMQQLKVMTQKTPFEFGTLVEGARYLKVMRLEEKRILPVMKMLGDVALGDNEKLMQLAHVMGKVINIGKLQGRELRSLAIAGFNPLAFMAQKSTRSMEFFQAKMRIGMISANEVIDVLKYATSEGKMFYKGTEKLADTLAGKLSILRDNIFIASASFGELLLPSITKITEKLITFAKYMDAMPISTKKNINTFLGWAATVGPIVLGLGALTTAIAKLLLLKSALAVFGISLGAAFAPLLVLTGLVATVAAADALLKRAQEEREKEIERMAKEEPAKFKYMYEKRAPLGGAVPIPGGGMMQYTGMPLRGPGESYMYRGKQSAEQKRIQEEMFGPESFMRTPVGAPEVNINVVVEVDDGLVAKIKKINKKNVGTVNARVDSSLGYYIQNYSRKGMK
jgi:hypothetical protein